MRRAEATKYVRLPVLLLSAALTAAGCTEEGNEGEDDASPDTTTGETGADGTSDSGSSAATRGPDTGEAGSSGGAADSGTTGGEPSSDSTGETGAAVDECEPVMQPGSREPSGLELCEPSHVWRLATSVECLPTPALEPGSDPSFCGECDAFAAEGFCADAVPPVQQTSFCHYDCTTDEDCGPGAVCVCAAEGFMPFNQCMEAECLGADDCGDYDCGFSYSCGLPSGTHCRSEADECRGDDDCPPPGGPPADSDCRWRNSDDAFTCNPDLECR